MSTICQVVSYVLPLQSYERQSRAIKSTSEKEKKYWSDVTRDMMSDEEKDGNIHSPPLFLQSKPIYSEA